MGVFYVKSCWWIGILCLAVQGPSLAQLQPILTLRNQAEHLYEEGKFKKATRIYQQAYQLCMLGRYYEQAANLLVDISSMEHLNGHYREGTVLCLKGIDLLNRVAQPADSSLFKLNASLGELYRQQEYVDSSAFYFAKADRLLNDNSALPDQIPEYVIYHFSNQSMLHELIGRFSLSETLALKALQLTQHYHLPDDEAIVRNVVAGQYERVGKYLPAMQLRWQGLVKYRQKDLQRARMYSGIGRNALYQKKYKYSLTYLLRSYYLYKLLQKQEEVQEDTKKVVLLCNHLGRCYLALGQFERADDFFDEAIQIYIANYGPRGRPLADGWLMKGKICGLFGQSAKALNYAQEALNAIILPTTSLNKYGNPPIEKVLDERMAVEVLSFKGSLFSRLDEWEKALQTYQCAATVFEQARRHLYLLEDKLYLSETVLPMYQQAKEVAYRYYQSKRTQVAFDAAFSLLEEGRASALQDFMAESALRPKYLSEIEIIHESALRQKLSQAISALVNNPSPVQQQVLIAQVHTLRHQHYQLLRKWEETYPDYFQSRFISQPILSRQVQEKLTPKNAYLSFSYDRGKLQLFAITKERSIWKTITVDSTQLVSTLQLLKKSLNKHPNLGTYTGTPYALLCFEWFIAPLLTEIAAKEEWIINTGGILDGLPVEVFETGKIPNDYLTRHYTIRYVYTASLLTDLSIPTSSDPPKVLAIAPFTQPIRAAINNQFHYQTLVASQDEVMHIDAKRLLDEQATRSNFMKEYREYAIWYFSTHAVLNTLEPMRSYIAFYPEDTSFTHRIYADEISQMDLRHVRLVALNACDAGGGKMYQSEGIMSLARAFAYAGCPVTINTLWTSQDRSSAFLVKRTHYYLIKGDSPALSLRKSRTDFFEAEENRQYNHPYFWANFVVIGSNAPLYETHLFSIQQISCILVSLLILFLIFRRLHWI
jgi:CHAT domain-containing protein